MGGGEWHAVFDQAPAPTAVFDAQGRCRYVNPAFCTLLGHDARDFLQPSPHDTSGPGNAFPRTAIVADALARGHAIAETQHHKPDGQTIWLRLSGSAINDTAGGACHILVQAEDITTHRSRETLWERCFATAPIGMALLDLQGQWTTVNDALCDLLGYRRNELLAMNFSDLTYPGDHDQGNTALAELCEGRAKTVSVEKRYRHKDGHPIMVLIRSSAITGPDGMPSFLVSHYEAIGNGRMTDTQLAHLALHDPLTGLANRALLTDRLHHNLAALAGGSGVLAVLLADLDGLKQVNDQYGHLVGDHLLIAAAHALLAGVEPGATVARLGGDEFVVLGLVNDIRAAEALQDRIGQLLNTQITAAGHQLNLKASVGIAMTQDPTTPPQELLHAADQDMYTRKKTRNK
ncbi:diguanylate cyclase domain-containing protein [Saccharopolyspora elongata]|uniref:Diguanylate cyclase n=1 Tax=Saccharopolyspora elongata TaxID=2530387 RepID=A0A4V2YIF4_9PSEU|nr:diguanylate cyclase [Saccharopolyspora elongata]TDD34647.1 diguanylate cyclase [Saccharopolyspora elongata]